MTYTRIYSDSAGETHFEDVQLEMNQSALSGWMSDTIAAKGVIFRRTKGKEYFLDWHNAPRRQFVVTLTGEVEIVASDGEMRRFPPGSVLLAEDVTGKGHISRGIGDAERLSMFIPLG